MEVRAKRPRGGSARLPDPGTVTVAAGAGRRPWCSRFREGGNVEKYGRNEATATRLRLASAIQVESYPWASGLRPRCR